MGTQSGETEQCLHINGGTSAQVHSWTCYATSRGEQWYIEKASDRLAVLGQWPKASFTPKYVKYPGAMSCPADQVVKTEIECKLAGESLGFCSEFSFPVAGRSNSYPYIDEAESKDRPGGCFWERDSTTLV